MDIIGLHTVESVISTWTGKDLTLHFLFAAPVYRVKFEIYAYL